MHPREDPIIHQKGLSMILRLHVYTPAMHNECGCNYLRQYTTLKRRLGAMGKPIQYLLCICTSMHFKMFCNPLQDAVAAVIA